MTPIVYLHGFASSPQSSKAQFFRRKFAERGVTIRIPRLDEANFEGLTITRQLGVIERAAAGERVGLIGSSLGGYLAALYAARHSEVEWLVLMAPAFQFPRRWRERFSQDELAEWKRRGSRTFFHYGYKEDRPLGYHFVEDAVQYEDEPGFRQPALVLHGTEDPVVPAEVSREFAASHPNVTLRLLRSGHELTDVLDELWVEAARFQNL
jgi:pimeloyl-ACP methyl ester carboxylesterase